MRLAKQIHRAIGGINDPLVITVLIATISVMVLLLMMTTLGMLSLSTIELRQSSHVSYQEEAKANAGIFDADPDSDSEDAAHLAPLCFLLSFLFQ